MTKSVHTITAEDIEQIVELDGLNMAPVMALQNIVFDRQRRLQSLLEEIQKEAEFLFFKKAGRILGYIEYFPRPKNVHIASIQIHSDFRQGIVLRKLLSEAADVAKRLEHHRFTTSVHNSNLKSLKLHKMLGFIQTGRTDERILFEISANNLYNTLHKFKPNRYE